MTAQRIRQGVFSASILFHLALLTPFVFMTRTESVSTTPCISLSLTSPATQPHPVQPVQQNPEPLPRKKERTVKPEPQKPLPAALTTTSQDAHPHSIRQESAAENTSAVTPQAVPASLSASYLSIVRNRIEAKKHYPPFARNLQQEGTVVLNVVIGSDGVIISSSLVNSSGYASLDRAALAAVQKVSPFPAPTGFGLGRMSVTIPLVFKLI